MNLVDELQKLTTLHEQAALTDDEFSLAKKKLIEGLGLDDAATPNATLNTGASLEQKQSLLHQLHRSQQDRWIAGVCGGLAEATQIPTWSWRMLFVLLTLLHGIGALIYILLWIFVPLKIERAVPPDSGLN